MGAPSKRAKKVRKAEEFNVAALVARLESVRASAGAYSWSLSEIQAARDAQMAGNFKLPARLAESFRTDDAMFSARRTRCNAHRAIPVEIVPASTSAAAARIATEADALFGPKGIALTPPTIMSVVSQLVDHGVAFATCTWTPRLDGSRWDLQVNAWPIEWVRWNPTERCFMTAVDRSSMTELAKTQLENAYQPVAFGAEVPIVHGDGRFLVFQASEIEPWKEGCLLPGALVWARHAFGLRDLLQSSGSHGNAKVVGELPEGVTIDSKEGADFLTLLVAIASANLPVGIKPRGSSVDYLVNQSRAWEIFRELATISKLSAYQIYLGQDGSLGTNPTGPGVDLRSLLGVTDDIAEGDLHTLEQGFETGAIQPWTAKNFGDSTLAPSRDYLIPDADQGERRAEMARSRIAFYDALERERGLDFDVTPERIKALAKEYGVSVAEIKSALPTPQPLAGAAPRPPATNGAPLPRPASPAPQ